MLLNKIKRHFLGLIGTVWLVIAIFFILFPILPSRPILKFVKLCYFNSSAELYQWLTNHKIFGTILNGKIIISKRAFVIRVVFLFVLFFSVMFLTTNVTIRMLATIIFVFSTLNYYYKTLK